MKPRCPVCGSAAKEISNVLFRKNGKDKVLLRTYRCTNESCKLYGPCDLECPTEFVIKDRKKIIVRPSACDYS